MELNPLVREHANGQQRVRVGVTGHRVLTDVELIIAGVRRGLATIRQAYPNRLLTVVSALAEGADRIVAKEVLRTPGGRLAAVLPFPTERYVQDFGPPSSASRRQFQRLLRRATEVEIMQNNLPRDEAYVRAGWHVVEHCDVLLAVWDGRAAQGRGGTAAIVQHARASGKPLVIVRAGNRRPGTNAPTSLGTEQGRVVVERLPSGH